MEAQVQELGEHSIKQSQSDGNFDYVVKEKASIMATALKDIADIMVWAFERSNTKTVYHVYYVYLTSWPTINVEVFAEAYHMHNLGSMTVDLYDTIPFGINVDSADFLKVVRDVMLLRYPHDVVDNPDVVKKVFDVYNLAKCVHLEPAALVEASFRIAEIISDLARMSKARSIDVMIQSCHKSMPSGVELKVSDGKLYVSKW